MESSTTTWPWYQCKICHSFLQTKDKIWAHLCTKHSTETTLNKRQIPDVVYDWEIVTSIEPSSQIWVKVEGMDFQEGQELNHNLVLPTPSSPRVPNPFKCHNCYKTFAKSQHLRNHRMLSKVMGCRIGKKPKCVTVTLFTCSVCQMDFKDRKSLLVHKFDQGHEPDHEVQSIYTCQYDGCDLNFRTPKTLELHKCTHDPRWKEMTIAQRMEFKVERVVGIGATVYPCPLCPTKVVFKWLLPKHLEKHSKDRPFKCDKCLTAYKTESVLKIHLKGNKCERKLLEMEINRFECEICKKFLKSEKYLRYHKSAFHGIIPDRIKEFKCLFCGYLADCASGLVRHNRTHTGERPFECQGCGKAFGANHNMIAHMRHNCKKLSGIVAVPPPRIKKPRIGVEENVEDPLHLEKCPHCPQTFSQKRFLTMHKKIHGNNFCCTDCGVGDVGFIALSSLSRHYKAVHGPDASPVKQCLIYQLKWQAENSSFMEKKHCWAEGIATMLKECEFSDPLTCLTTEKLVQLVKTIPSILQTNLQNKDVGRMLQSSFIPNYKILKPKVGQEEYFGRNYSLQKFNLLAQLRLNKFSIKIGTSIIRLGTRCPLCCSTSMTSVEHYLFECRVLEKDRKSLIQPLLSFPIPTQSSPEDLYLELFSQKFNDKFANNIFLFWFVVTKFIDLCTED